MAIKARKEKSGAKVPKDARTLNEILADNGEVEAEARWFVLEFQDRIDDTLKRLRGIQDYLTKSAALEGEIYPAGIEGAAFLLQDQIERLELLGERISETFNDKG